MSAFALVANNNESDFARDVSVRLDEGFSITNSGVSVDSCGRIINWWAMMIQDCL